MTAFLKLIIFPFLIKIRPELIIKNFILRKETKSVKEITINNTKIFIEKGENKSLLS